MIVDWFAEYCTTSMNELMKSLLPPCEALQNIIQCLLEVFYKEWIYIS